MLLSLALPAPSACTWTVACGASESIRTGTRSRQTTLVPGARLALASKPPLPEAVQAVPGALVRHSQVTAAPSRAGSKLAVTCTSCTGPLPLLASNTR